ncbi:uncharacterized protein LOC130696178 isoform X2 [Daphnia carinata]|uniref:uncharacterized protein LOC130696178 isoform X2 n=1 Tax=Daphnia carinata TaxID=120202 RepID=UPI00257EE210|nr:uncharacterized protein LOC130696178 isoform X2 [Daphnia carinata]
MQENNPQQDQIIMTPGKRTANSTTIMVERRPMVIKEQQENLHVAGGAHKGIVINKSSVAMEDDTTPAQLSLEFCVYLVNAATNMHTKESRQLRFWFKEVVSEWEQPKVAQEFFKKLVAPFEFPRDYVGFIKKIMKLMQQDYPTLRKIEVELKQLGQSSQPPPDTGIMDQDVSLTEIEVTSTRLLEMIESAYPNPLSVSEMARQTQSEKQKVSSLLSELQASGLVKTVNGNESFTRVVQNENKVKVVKQMPKIVQAKQPTIAIITAQYCEKLAVDAMMDDQETFVRYTTVGESNIYTLGNIGQHRVVCTKLPTVGHTREALIASGSTTTRLLGTFQAVEFVILVGVGGGVPHYTDCTRHVRLGDVVVSSPIPPKKDIYTYCELEPVKEGQTQTNPVYETKSWAPPTFLLQEISARLKAQGDDDPTQAVWDKYITEGISKLSKDGVNFARPPDDTDKLYMSLGGSDVIEVTHPTGSSENGRQPGKPVIHLGPIAAGRQVSKDDQLRQDFAARFGILAFDMEYDAVIESVYGNRKDSYLIVRGIADYKDGSRKKDWQPYASLAAAAFTKAVVCAMNLSNDD